jgi:photosystem II stability/assembly factor-like uncharacterized protein
VKPIRRLASAPLAALLLAPLAAAQKPPLTKEEERMKFHPSRRGMDAATRLEGWTRRLEMEAASPLQALRFRSVGPEVQGGRVVDVEGIPDRPDSLLVAYATGGLWRTDNQGGSWTPLFDNESSITIGDVAVADRAAQTIYVGTGESNSSRTSYAGTGIFRTTDGGKSWKNLGLHDTHHVARVLVDRRDPRTVFVAAAGHLYTENAERGVWKSTDGGETWRRTLFLDERTGAIDLVQDPSKPQVLYAATWERARTAANFLESGPGSGVHRSEDGGETWTRLAGGLPSGTSVGRIGLALCDARPDTVYALVDHHGRRPDSEPFDEEAPPGELTPRRLRKFTPETFAKLPDETLDRFLRRSGFPKDLKAAALKRDVKAGKVQLEELTDFMKDANQDLFEASIFGPEVWRTDDGGRAWRKTHEGRIDKVFHTYGYYFGRITVDPTDAERVYFFGVPALGSADGGRTWKGLDRRGVHVDHHALWIDPKAPHRLALGNDGGLNLSWDHGEHWVAVKNVPVGQFTTLALDDAEPYNILGGLQDNGVMRGPSTWRPGKSDPEAWKTILGGDGSCIAVDPKDPDVVYCASQFGAASRLNLKTGARAAIRPRPEFTAEKKEKPLRYNWVTPFILSPHSREILWYGANRLYRSFDRGETWAPVSEDLTSNREQGDVPFGTITSIAESPKRFGVLWVGTDEGRVWGTRDGGASWNDLSAGLAPGRWVTRVVASAFDEGTVYVSQNGYRDDDFTPWVWRSTDHGKTWESLAAGLPAEPVNTVREDPKAKHLLYVGTDTGVFVSLERGKSWIPLATGLPRVPVHDLLVHPREGDLVLATHGRSVMVADAAPLRKLDSAAAMAKALVAFPVKSLMGSERRGYGENQWITWARDEPVTRIAWWAAAGGGGARITVQDEHGNPWRTMESASAQGLNVVEYGLEADPKLADAAEAAAREKALAKAAKAKEGEPRADGQEKKEGGDEEAGEEKPAARGGGQPLDQDVLDLLADPLRASRRRFLPPGKYTVLIAVGENQAKTTLTVKGPRRLGAEED